MFGKAAAEPHRREQDAKEEVVPTVAMDYMYMAEEGEESASPILVGIDKPSRTVFAHVVPEKGESSICSGKSGDRAKKTWVS